MTIVFETTNIFTNSFESLDDLLAYLCRYSKCTKGRCPFYEAGKFETNPEICLVAEYFLIRYRFDRPNRKSQIREEILKRLMLHQELLKKIVNITTVVAHEDQNHKTVIEIEKKEKSK